MEIPLFGGEAADLWHVFSLWCPPPASHFNEAVAGALLTAVGDELTPVLSVCRSCSITSRRSINAIALYWRILSFSQFANEIH